MPKLWSKTIDGHRHAVREAALDAAAALVSTRGLASVTMSQIAAKAGIGRASLYKYFPDAGSILTAWHERQVGNHFSQLLAIHDGQGNAVDRLTNVLQAFALICHEHQASELAALLHRGKHVVQAERRLTGLVTDLLAEGVKARGIRKDVAPQELAAFCLHALSAASDLSSKAAVYRLVEVTLRGVQSNRS